MGYEVVHLDKREGVRKDDFEVFALGKTVWKHKYV